MTTLSPADAKLFHKLMEGLLFFVNKNLNVIKNSPTKETFFQGAIEQTIPLRKKIFSDCLLIESFVTENPERLNSDELNIVSSWKSSIEGEFFLTKYTKEYALLLSPKEQKAYGVVGITDSFSEMFNGFAPIMLKIRLLPFREKIIYEGIFFPYRVSFGKGMRSSLKVETETAIQKHGIITSLDAPVIEKNNSDEEMLRFYFKTQDNRDRYSEEIEKLKKKSPELEAVYYQEEAGISSRNIKKILKTNGVNGYFAVLVNTVVASGLNDKELNANIRKIVPAEKQNWLYRFKL